MKKALLLVCCVWWVLVFSACSSSTAANQNDEQGGTQDDTASDDPGHDFKKSDAKGDSDVLNDGDVSGDTAAVDADANYPKRSCQTTCGAGNEYLIDGTWQGCTAPKTGDSRECMQSNEFGLCKGKELCDEASGWGTCDAKKPEIEYYDGTDNNCNGEIDEGVVNPVTDGTIGEGLVGIDKNDPENPTKEDGISLSKQSKVLPYLWAANHEYGTVSKFNTKTHKEEGRYWTGKNVSRTVVDLNGNMWVGGRDDGRLTMVMWDTAKCPDKNSNGSIETSVNTAGAVNVVNSEAEPFADECVLYSTVPKADRPSIRGLAVDPSGLVWIGYTAGGVQVIDPETFTLGEFYDSNQIPVFEPDGQGIFSITPALADTGGVYGQVIDSNGILYISSINRQYLPAFDTNTRQWVGVYKHPGECSYGIAVDAKNRIWLGGWPKCGGVVLFDSSQKKAWTFGIPDGTTATPKGTVTAQVVANGGNQGTGDAFTTTGVCVEPATGDVWASFVFQGYNGRLKLNEGDYSKSVWTFIATTRDASNNFLSGVGSDLRGIGFDSYGYAWTLGLGSDRVWKIDPATNERAATLPYGLSIGTGSHYTYSDFTGSTAFNFTAPRGTWSYIFNKPSECALPTRIDVKAHVPQKTTMGVRIRPLDMTGNPASEWVPFIKNGQKYFEIPQGTGTTQIDLAEFKEYLIAPKYEIEVLMTTKDKSVRPILNFVNILWKYDGIACDE